MRSNCFYIEPWFGAGVGLAECLGRRSTFFENKEGNLVDGERYRNTVTDGMDLASMRFQYDGALNN